MPPLPFAVGRLLLVTGLIALTTLLCQTGADAEDRTGCRAVDGQIVCSQPKKNQPKKNAPPDRDTGTSQQPQRGIVDTLTGSRWTFNYQGNVYQFVFGATAIEEFSNNFWPRANWQPLGPNQVRVWNFIRKGGMTLTFDSTNSYSGVDWDGIPISGRRM